MANDFKALSDEVKPRERILSAGSARALSSCELLAVLLKTGSAGCDVLELAKRLLSAFGSIEEMVMCDLAAFRRVVKNWNTEHPAKKILGLGQVKMLELLAAFEFVRRGCRRRRMADVESMDDLVEMFHAVMGNGLEQECFMIVPLDTDNRVIRPPEIVTKGLRTASLADAREVFSRAMKWGASSIVLAHNHPDGDATPSQEDVELTKCIEEAGNLLGIDLMDHLVLDAEGNFTSMRELGVVK